MKTKRCDNTITLASQNYFGAQYFFTTLQATTLTTIPHPAVFAQCGMHKLTINTYVSGNWIWFLFHMLKLFSWLYFFSKGKMLRPEAAKCS